MPRADGAATCMTTAAGALLVGTSSGAIARFALPRLAPLPELRTGVVQRLWSGLASLAAGPGARGVRAAAAVAVGGGEDGVAAAHEDGTLRIWALGKGNAPPIKVRV